MILTSAVLLTAVLAALLVARVTQPAGRHRDRGYRGATPGFALLLNSWNRTNHDRRPT